MSSRNAYLSPGERKQALALQRALSRIQILADKGECEAERLIAAGKQVISDEPGVRLDYLEIVDPQTLEARTDVARGGLVAVAAFVGSTRLIDNLVL
jgi:pantoate--beta-alanine ligase